uniref:ANK_REP_REGION domain-containing protein n=1 Tax=Mesocestoides corti TaxID=53468 RepID=A0A5K3G1X9_MESCO
SVHAPPCHSGFEPGLLHENLETSKNTLSSGLAALLAFPRVLRFTEAGVIPPPPPHVRKKSRLCFLAVSFFVTPCDPFLLGVVPLPLSLSLNRFTFIRRWRGRESIVWLAAIACDHTHATAAGNGYTALHIAAKRNHLDLASLLLANDRDPKKSTNRESRGGFTPLHLASQEGNADMVGLLLLNGADVEHKAKNGVTPMHLAALEDRVTVAQQLVSAGAQANAVTVAGYTPLHTACYAGRLNMARFLIALPTCNVNASTNAGFTPLHLAAQQGHSDIVYLLLEHGAEPNATNS